MKYEYRFHPHGTSAVLAPEEGSLWLDIGNGLSRGVIDHHQSNQYSCTAELVYRRSELFSYLAGREKPVVIHTHQKPDTDALFSIYLVQFYLEHACFPECIDRLLSFAVLVDEGKVVINEANIGALYSVLIFIFQKEKDDELAVKRALALIDATVRYMNTDSEYSLMDSEIVAPEQFKEEILEAGKDYKRYRTDRKDGICVEKRMRLPLKGGQISEEEVPCLFWREAPSCSFNRIWARNEGFVLTLVPLDDGVYSANDHTYDCSHVIISLPPEVRSFEGKEFSLLPLARYLEQYEQEREEELFGKNNNIKRDHSTHRGQIATEKTLFAEAPFSETRDPWYLSADETLLQTPFSGSLLKQSEILNVAETFSECLLRCSECRVVLPFRFDLRDYSGIKNEFAGMAQSLSGDKNPWVNEKRYLNCFLRDYTENPDSYSMYMMQRPDAPGLDGFENQMYVMLFSYGIGFYILSRINDYSGKSVTSSLGMEHLNDSRFVFEEWMNAHASVLFALIKHEHRFLDSHFYTCVEASPENLCLSNSPLAKYAGGLCLPKGILSGNARTEALNYRQVLAYTRYGCALVSCVRGENETVSLFFGEWFYLYLVMLQQYYTLMECKRQLVNMPKGKSRAVRRLREMMIQFSSKGFFTTVAEDELGDRLYRAWQQEIFMIPEIRTDVTEQLTQLDEYFENKLTGTLNKVSVWILPLVIISTVFQCSLFAMQPLVEIGEKGFAFDITDSMQTLQAWGIIGGALLIIFILILLFRRRK